MYDLTRPEEIISNAAFNQFISQGPIATSSPEPGQALTQQNQAMQNMINMLRKQMEKEVSPSDFSLPCSFDPA